MLERNLKKLANLLRKYGFSVEQQILLTAAILLARQKTSDNLTPNAISKLIDKHYSDYSFWTATREQALKLLSLDSTDSQQIISLATSLEINGNPDLLTKLWQNLIKYNNGGTNVRGEVFTPFHIATLMAELLVIDDKDTVVDPACGQGALLLAASKAQKLFGYEIVPFYAQVAKINLLLAGHNNFDIELQSLFESVRKIKYNKIIANPPFGIKGNPELSFALKAIKDCKVGGQMAIVLPKSALTLAKKFKSGSNVDYLSQILAFCHLRAVISLPGETFLPNAGVATAIAIFTKVKDYHSKEAIADNPPVQFINLSSDGFVNYNGERKDVGPWAYILEQVKNTYFSKIAKPNLSLFANLGQAERLLYESFASTQNQLPSEQDFISAIRDHCSAKVRLGKHYSWPVDKKQTPTIKLAPFYLRDILTVEGTGKQRRSIDKKLVNKYTGSTPLIIAKKDNNGVGGTINGPVTTWKDKIVIINGGDGGGGKTYYCDFEFAATSFVTICDLKDNLTMDYYAKLYLTCATSYLLHKYINHGFRFKDCLDNLQIWLPVDENGYLNTQAMSDYILSLPVFD